MYDWVDFFRIKYLKFPEMVVLVKSDLFNPEPFLYY